MPYPKLHEEFYSNFGGVNRKASRYITGVNQSLNLENCDFSRLGSHTTRPGSTAYIGATISGRITGFYEYTKLSGASYIVVTANTNVYTAQTGSFVSFRSGALSTNPIWDFAVFSDYLFGVGENWDVFKFNGTTAVNYSLPPGLTYATTPTIRGTGVGTVVTGFTTVTGLSGLLQYAYGYLNDRGYYGPAINCFGVSCFGATEILLNLAAGFTTPAGFGISAIILYRGFSGGQLAQIDALPPTGGATANFYDNMKPLQARLANNNLWVFSGFTTVLVAPYATFGNLIDVGIAVGPKCVELYNNQLLLGNFVPYTYVDFNTNSAVDMRSRVYCSDIGEPEGIAPDAFYEFRTNDGDYVSNIMSALSQALVWKTKSMHALTGDDPDNFAQREITSDYGCLSKRAACNFQTRVWFLDSQGVAEFNGADVKIISNEIEDIFQNMNIPVAKDQAWMMHVKERNEVWTGIPYAGASTINLVCVYDYLAQAWWFLKGPELATPAKFYGRFPQKTVGYGGYTGTLYNFGATLIGDNGAGFTCVDRFGFVSNAQHSVQKVFRQLWIDTDPTVGTTTTVEVNFYTDQRATAALTRLTTVGGFQQRLEYGLSAKDCSVEFIWDGNSPLRLNGYSISHRFQRNV